MKIPIDFVVRGRRSDVTGAVREYALRKISFALRRFTHRVRSLTVRLVDLNGPRGGVDTRCSITADLVGGGRHFVEATAAWPFAAITLASGRFNEVLRREGDRHLPRRAGSPDGSRHLPEGGLPV
jgi:ribosome-associated translation inhibitor RaiA